MSKRIDQSTLSWVRQEIDDTLKQARSALEEYVENPEDMTQLRFCQTYLHQVNGSLQMVELYGAALLVEEMEKLVLGLLDNRVSQKEESYEILMRGILQLPDYLERVQGGLRDDPLIFLPMLNDMRAARGENLLSENSLFTPDIDNVAPIEVERPADLADVDLQALAKKQRHAYQVGLLNWYRDKDPKSGLRNMDAVLEKLEQASTEQPVIRLWWVARGLIEALLEDGLESSVALKLLMGQVDRRIKQLIDHGEQQLSEEMSGQLLTNLLYYVARASSSGERVSAVRQTFGLEGLLATQEELESARESLGGPNEALFETVAVAIRDDLGRVKDALDLYLRSGKNDIQELAPYCDDLHRIADTLGMLGQGVPRKVIQEQETALRAMLGGELDVSEARLMEIAGSLLYAESSLEGISMTPTAESQADQILEGIKRVSSEEAGEAGVMLPESEFRQIRDLLLREICVDMAKAKEAIVSFIDSPWDFDRLEDVPRLFDEIRGGMEMLSLDYAALMLRAVRDYIVDDIQAKRLEPGQEELDTLADAIISIEYYLEGVLENVPGRGERLEVAHHSLSRLGHPVELPEGLHWDEAESKAADATPEDAGTETETGAEAIQPAATEAREETQAPAKGETADGETPAEPAVPDEADAQEPEGPVVTDEEPPEFELPEVEPVALEPLEVETPAAEQETAEEQQAPAAEDAQPSAGERAAALLEDVDDDILEIFIEEAREELGVIHELLPKWIADHEDHESLTRFRRSFHTLKGSGRLVGAEVVGELAWSVENLLNRIIDNTVPVMPEMIEMIQQSTDVLDALIGQMQGGPAPAADPQALIERGFELVELGKESQKRPEEQIVEELSAAEEEEEESAEGIIDPALYEIFSKESSGHLQTIRHFIDTCTENSDACHVTDALVRALHTLHGSARMAEVEKIAELAGICEKYVKALMTNEEPVSGEGMAVLAGSVQAIENMLEELASVAPSRLTADTGVLLDKVGILYAVEQEKIDERQRREQAELQKEGGVAPASPEQRTDYDTDLVEVFLEEGFELIDHCESVIGRWRENPDDRATIAGLQRDLHTLKGGARMANVSAIGDLSHSMESLLTAITEEQLEPQQVHVDAVQQGLDVLFRMLDQLRDMRPVEPAQDMVARFESLLKGGEPADVEQPDQTEPEPEPEPPRPVEMVEIPPVSELAAQQPVRPTRESVTTQETVRVSSLLLDDLVNHAGEVSIYRSRLEQQVGAFAYNLEELEQTIVRLREQLRKLQIETDAQIISRYEKEVAEMGEEFDPLEMDRYSTLQQLSRSLMESVGDFSSLHAILDNQVREAETLLVQQARVNTELQEGLIRTRMVPFTGIVSRLQRIVRQTANELGRKVRLEVSGVEGEVDRTVLERIVAPLEHMLRNAIAHGIEPPAERKKAGKPEQGSIELDLSREGTEVVLRVSDDGRGLDLDAIRGKAMEKGLLTSDDEVTDSDIMQFILESGFSTAEEITQIAGRGVGMDVVNSEIKQLGGSLFIESQQGKGATFVIRLPLTLAVNQALLASVGEEHFAIPLASIEGIVRMTADELKEYFRDPGKHFQYAGNQYQVQSLGARLGLMEPSLPEGQHMFPVILARSGDHHTAFQVDALLGSREIVVKSVGPQLSIVRGISGATILGDGSVVLILDMGAVIRMRTITHEEEEHPVIEPEQKLITAMVVDDSITVRKVTKRLLERNGMQVITAKDGVDAVAQLQDVIPDVMLLDIEMPRMDGFEVATHMRNEERLKGIPIIMITSRTGEKHRQRAREIGVERYLGKPYQEAELLETIAEVVKD